jgi:hypothetical protein
MNRIEALRSLSASIQTNPLRSPRPRRLENAGSFDMISAARGNFDDSRAGRPQPPVPAYLSNLCTLEQAQLADARPLCRHSDGKVEGVLVQGGESCVLLHMR